MGSTECSPSDKISDEIFLQAGLAVFALLRKQKHRSVFLTLSRIKQFMRYCHFSKEQIPSKLLHLKWAVQGSNLWPSACEADALPLRQLPNALLLFTTFVFGLRGQRVPAFGGRFNLVSTAPTAQNTKNYSIYSIILRVL